VGDYCIVAYASLSLYHDFEVITASKIVQRSMAEGVELTLYYVLYVIQSLVLLMPPVKHTKLCVLNG
jgi:hypothetical protein